MNLKSVHFKDDWGYVDIVGLLVSDTAHNHLSSWHIQQLNEIHITIHKSFVPMPWVNTSPNLIGLTATRPLLRPHHESYPDRCLTLEVNVNQNSPFTIETDLGHSTDLWEKKSRWPARVQLATKTVSSCFDKCSENHKKDRTSQDATGEDEKKNAAYKVIYIWFTISLFFLAVKVNDQAARTKIFSQDSSALVVANWTYHPFVFL